MKTATEDPHVWVRLTDQQIDALVGRGLDKAVANYLGYRVEPYPEQFTSGDYRFYFANKKGDWWEGGDLPEYHKYVPFALEMIPEIFELSQAVVKLEYAQSPFPQTNHAPGWSCTVRYFGAVRLDHADLSDGDSEGYVDPALPTADNNILSFCSAIWRTWMKLKNNEADDAGAVQTHSDASPVNSGAKTGDFEHTEQT